MVEKGKKKKKKQQSTSNGKGIGIIESYTNPRKDKMIRRFETVGIKTVV